MHHIPRSGGDLRARPGWCQVYLTPRLTYNPIPNPTQRPTPMVLVDIALRVKVRVRVRLSGTTDLAKPTARDWCAILHTYLQKADAPDDVQAPIRTRTPNSTMCRPLAVPYPWSTPSLILTPTPDPNPRSCSTNTPPIRPRTTGFA